VKRYLVFVGTYLMVQPSFFLGVLGVADNHEKIPSSELRSIPAKIEYKNEQVIITKANQRQKGRLPPEKDSSNLSLADLETYIIKLEDNIKIEPSDGFLRTTQLGQKMKKLAETFLFTG
jgi:hypothetical protein